MKTKKCPACGQDKGKAHYGEWRWAQDGKCFSCEPKARKRQSQAIDTIAALAILRAANRKRSETICPRCGTGVRFDSWDSYENFCEASRRRSPLPFECNDCHAPKRPENASVMPK